MANGTTTIPTPDELAKKLGLGSALPKQPILNPIPSPADLAQKIAAPKKPSLTAEDLRALYIKDRSQQQLKDAFSFKGLKLEPIESPLTAVPRLAGQAARGFIRGSAELGSGIASEITGQESFTPGTDPVSQFFLGGRKEIPKLSKQGSETLEAFGVPESVSKTPGVGLFSGIGLVALDVTGIGKLRALKLIKNAETIEQGLDIARKLKVPASLEKEAAERFVAAGTDQAAEEAIREMNRLTRTEAEDIGRISNNLQKNNPGLARKEAEAMARDLRSNAKFAKDNAKDVSRDPEFINFERDKKLIGEDAKIQEASIAKVVRDKARLVDEYIKNPKLSGSEGKIVNTDEARKLFKDVGYKGYNAAAVQEASSKIGKEVYAKLLKEAKEPDVLIYAGGSGAGKTSSVKGVIPGKFKDAGVIFDGNLSNIKSAKRSIKMAIDAGKDPEIVYVYRDPVDAFEEGVIKRMIENPEEGRRIVPIDVFVGNHAGSHQTVKQLLSENNVPISLIDNSFGPGKAAMMDLDRFNKIEFPQDLREKLVSILKKELQSGRINKKEYDQFLAEAGDFKPFGAPEALNVTKAKASPLQTLTKRVEGQLETTRKATQEAAKDLELSAKRLSSTINDSKKLGIAQTFNTANLNISKEGKELIDATISEAKPLIEAKVGKTLSNKEALELAESSTKLLNRAVGREATLEWEAAMLKTRQKLAAMAESGTVDKEYLDALMTIKTLGTDLGRKLQSLSIGADPLLITSKEAILDAIIKAGKSAEEILEAAKDVDFTDFRQATEFYRKFVKPTSSEWIDLLRYNSMLSSPSTHINNAFSNLLNSSLIAPLEKAVTGGLDFIGSKITGRAREVYAGEALEFVKGYARNLKDATDKFTGVMSGKVPIRHLDLRSIPLSSKGLTGQVAKVLAYPTKLLEASDQFFTALVTGAERAALDFRKAKGIDVPLAEIKASQKASYRLFRQELHPEGQGILLNAVDEFTAKVEALRKSDNAIVSNVAKFTVPFIRTPMNIFKQGIEYSPAGFLTAIKAADKREQFAKAIIGSTVFAGAASMLGSDRLTWGEPVNADERNAFRAAGKLPYSIKIGNTWVQYQKLPPGVAFPFAMVAMIDDLQKSKKIDDTTTEMILGGIAKYGEFMADQSYAKSIGDLLSAAKGGEAGISKIFSNYPQQLVPFRALGGWLARLTDATQRQIDNKAGFVDKQIQLLMQNIPGLSQKLPARLGPTGEPIVNPNPILSALSPVKFSEENAKFKEFLDKAFEIKQIRAESRVLSEKLSEEAQAKFDELTALGKTDSTAANAMYAQIEQANPKLADKINDLWQDSRLDPLDKKIKTLGVENGDRAKFISSEIKKLKTAKERNDYYDALDEKGVINGTVAKQLDDIFNAPEQDLSQIKKDAKSGDKPKFQSGAKSSEKGIIETVLLYGQAIGSDPVAAFDRIFSGQKIRRVDSGTIIVERMSLAESQGVKRERGAEIGFKLDHTIPLQLGGSNSGDNLKLVSDVEWKSYTPVENFLGEQLRDGKMKKAEAQKLIRDFKEGKITAEEIYNR